MKENRREVRTMVGGKFQPRIREAEEGTGTGRMIEGYAIVFGVESRLLADCWDNYREIIESGAITAEELATMDIKMTMWHNREKLLARSNKGVGTLRLTVDETGVKYEFEAPNTADGDNALELVRRGDLAGSSFIYWSDEDHSVKYTKTEEGVLVRHVNKIDMVMEMTIASDPAYNQTNVTAREIEAGGIQLKKPEEEEVRKREANVAAISAVRERAKKRFFK